MCGTLLTEKLYNEYARILVKKIEEVDTGISFVTKTDSHHVFLHNNLYLHLNIFMGTVKRKRIIIPSPLTS